MACLALGLPAGAQTQPPGFDPSTCLLPDRFGPIFYNFVPGPSHDLARPGTYVEITVDDIPWYAGEPDSNANYINLVEVRVDGGGPIEMQPVDGRHRRIRNRYSVTFDPAQVTAGPYTLTFRSRDDCGRVDTHVEEIFVLAPGVVATCALPVDRLC